MGEAWVVHTVVVKVAEVAPMVEGGVAAEEAMEAAKAGVETAATEETLAEAGATVAALPETLVAVRAMEVEARAAAVTRAAQPGVA